MAAKPKKVKKADITLAPQVGTERDMLARWSWSRDNTYGYEVKWEYYTKDGIWFYGNTETVGTPSGGTKYATWTAPTLATKVRFAVTPISTAHVVNETSPNQAIDPTTGKNLKSTKTERTVRYWEAEQSAWKMYKFVVDKTPEDPDAPDIDIDYSKLSLKLITYDTNTTHIRFDIYKNDTTRVKTTSWIKLTTNTASFSTDIELGQQYKARAQAMNNSDKSTSEWSEWTSSISTAPSSINSTSLTCEAVSSTSVKLTWDKVDATATGYEIQYAQSYEYFDQSSITQSVTVGAVNPYAIIEGLETGKFWYFRIRATNDKGNSAWSLNTGCMLGTDPYAPTIWSSTASVVHGETITLYWRYSSEDGSKESNSEITINYPNGTSKVFEVSKNDDSEVSSYELTVDSKSMGEGQVTWGVRNYGLLGTWGPYSEFATFKILVQPTLGIGIYKTYEWLWDPFNFETDTIYTGPGVYTDQYIGTDVVITQYPFFIVVTMSPTSQTPIECNFSIYSESTYQALDHVGNKVWVTEGDRLYSKTIPYKANQESYGLTKNQFGFMLTPGDVLLENYMSYKLTCTVVSNNGLSADGDISIEMDIDEDSLIPDAELGLDHLNVITYIKPTCYDEDGEVMYGVRMSVYRREFDGGFIQVGTEVDSSSQTFIVDPHPNLNKAMYRIVGFSSTTGTYVYYDMPSYPVDVPEIILQWDEETAEFNADTEDGFVSPVWSGSMIRLPYNIDTSESNTKDVELVEYIGREHPVSYYGTQVGQTMTLNTDIPASDEDTIYALRRLARWMGNCYVREPNGAGYWAQVDVSFSTSHTEVVIPVSINVTRVEGGE